MRWIPRVKRVPSNRRQVLAYWKDRWGGDEFQITRCNIDSDGAIFDVERPRWKCALVTHWMELNPPDAQNTEPM